MGQVKGEPPLAGVRLFIDENGNGAYDAGEPSDLTDTNGVYGIGGLPAGTYTVVVDTATLPVNVGQTIDGILG